jgi:F0F1-type ATP synthase epsilon subunit
MNNNKNISVDIALPYKAMKTIKADKVVIPVESGDSITILDERAPTVFMLKAGLLQILNSDNKLIEQYFISNGICNYAEKKCTIAVNNINDDNITIDEATKLFETSELAEDKEFYSSIIDCIKLNKANQYK